MTGPLSIAITFSEPVTGFELVANGSASEPQGNDATYAATITPEASGTVTVDIPAGAAQDSAGNHSAAADQFSILADLAPLSGFFTDDPLQPRVTPVKAVHFTELRTRIDALREAAGLTRFSWTDPILRAGVTRGQAPASAGAPVGVGRSVFRGRALDAILDRHGGGGGDDADPGGAPDGAARRGGGLGMRWFASGGPPASPGGQLRCRPVHRHGGRRPRTDLAS